MFALAATVLAMLASCSKSEKMKIEYIPFQESKGGNWGMLSTDGKVLFSEEFKRAPTIATDGRFFYENPDGIWEMYTADEKPERVGGDYVHASVFVDGHAVVAEKGKPVSIIDTDGKTVKLLDQIEGKDVAYVTRFNREGYAAFITTDEFMGIIGTDGDCTVKPIYKRITSMRDGKAIAVKLADFEKNTENATVITYGGKELCTISAKKYTDIDEEGYQDGLLVVKTESGYGILDEKGEEVVKPSEKYKKITEVHGKKFIYNNGDAYGLMTTDGEQVIRAKYDGLAYADECLVAVSAGSRKMEFKLIDEDDKQIGEDTYMNILTYGFANGNLMALVNDNLYTMIDSDGKELKDLPDIVKIGDSLGDGWIESDFVDCNKLVAEAKIEEGGVAGLSTKSTGEQVAKAASEGEPDPKKFTLYNGVALNKTFFGVPAKVGVYCPDKIAETIYETKTKTYSFGYSYQYREAVGAKWVKQSPDHFDISVACAKGKMKGKAPELYKVLAAKFTPMGKTVAKEDGKYIVVKLKAAGNYAVVQCDDDEVKAQWGNVNPNNCGISGSFGE